MKHDTCLRRRVEQGLAYWIAFGRGSPHYPFDTMEDWKG